jgi:hypothetical protein
VFDTILTSIGKDEKIPQTTLNDFASRWLQLFRFPKLPVYLHILVEHFNEKLVSFGGLKEYSQEGVESHHLYEKGVQRRMTMEEAEE